MKSLNLFFPGDVKRQLWYVYWMAFLVLFLADKSWQARSANSNDFSCDRHYVISLGIALQLKERILSKWISEISIKHFRTAADGEVGALLRLWFPYGVKFYRRKITPPAIGLLSSVVYTPLLVNIINYQENYWALKNFRGNVDCSFHILAEKFQLKALWNFYFFEFFVRLLTLFLCTHTQFWEHQHFSKVVLTALKAGLFAL